MRDLTTKVNDTAPLATGVLDATEFNSLAAELEKSVSASGITLDPPDSDSRTDMLAESMTRHVGAALACSATGSANSYALAITGAFVAPVALVDNLKVRFRPPAANTGATTANVLSFGSLPVVDHTLADLVGGELETGREAELIYRASISKWVILAWANARYVDPSPTGGTTLTDGEGWKVDAGAGHLDFPGLTVDNTLSPSDVFARHKASPSSGAAGHRGITYAQILAALAAGAAGGGLLAVRLVTASGTFAKTPSCTKAIVFATGGGGGGGGNFGSNTASGGGAGGTAMALVDMTAITNVTCTIGAGGAGGSAGGGAGTAGGSTSFGTHAVAQGGKGGTGANGWHSRAGLGGSADQGLALFPGAPGQPASNVNGGSGGASFWGGAGIHGCETGSSPTYPEGGNATGYGSGGGGSDGHVRAGGSGRSGCILVLEFA